MAYSRQAARTDPESSGPGAGIPGALEVRALQAGEEAAWTAYVAAHPDATLYHSLPWRDVVHEVFGHQARYLIAARGAEVAGVLPLFLVRVPLLGAKLIGLPYDIGSGGPLASDAETDAALVRAAMELAEQLRVDYLELRLGGARESLDALGLVRSHPVVISDMDLTEGEKVWSQVSSDNRQSIRKARNRGVKVREAESMADCDAFYQVYLRAFRDFGTPPYGRAYFPTVWTRLGASKGVRLLLAEVEGRIVGNIDFHIARRRRLAHAGEFGMSVQSDWRSRGIGNALLESLIEWALTVKEVEKISLRVRADNPRAIALYKKHGFVTCGVARDAIRLSGGVYVDDIMMERFVRS